jgi:hypothetical protein
MIIMYRWTEAISMSIIRIVSANPFTPGDPWRAVTQPAEVIDELSV